MVKLTLEGKNLTPKNKPSIEKDLHLNIYKTRDDINAIIHVHPSIASTFAVVGKKINPNLFVESRIFLGIPAIVPFFRQGSLKLANAVSMAFRTCNVAIMQNHGIITAEKNMIEAYERVEILESAAKVTIITHLMNEKLEIPSEELEFLDSILK